MTSSQYNNIVQGYILTEGLLGCTALEEAERYPVLPVYPE